MATLSLSNLANSLMFLSWFAYVVPPSSSPAMQWNTWGRFCFLCVLIPPSSAFHEVKHLNVIGRDSWERDVSWVNETRPKNWGMHLLSNANARTQKQTVIGMRIIVVVVVELLLSKKNYCWVPLTSTLVFCQGETLVSFITCRLSAAVWRPPRMSRLLLWLVFRPKSCTSV